MRKAEENYLPFRIAPLPEVIAYAPWADPLLPFDLFLQIVDPTYSRYKMDKYERYVDREDARARTPRSLPTLEDVLPDVWVRWQIGINDGDGPVERGIVPRAPPAGAGAAGAGANAGSLRGGRGRRQKHRQGQKRKSPRRAL